MEEYIRDITVCIKSFMRERKTRECIASWQAQYPGIKFVIIDDGPNHDTQNKFYEQLRKEGNTVIKTEFDIGLTAGRNLAMENVRTKYALILDNDHFAVPTCNLEWMHRILEHRKDVSIVGGQIEETVKDVERYPRYDGFLDIETTKGGERILRYTRPKEYTWETQDEIKFTWVEVTHNFLLVRRSNYPNLKWDESMKVCGDHTDFFLEAKTKGYKTVYIPDCVVWHNYPLDSEDENPEYDKYRFRRWYLNVFGRKWGLDMAVNFYKQIHVYDYNK